MDGTDNRCNKGVRGCNRVINGKCDSIFLLGNICLLFCFFPSLASGFFLYLLSVYVLICA